MPRARPLAPRPGADVLARAHVEAVVEGEFQHLHEVEVAGEDVGLLAEGAHLDAARAAAFAGVLEGLALTELLFHHRVSLLMGFPFLLILVAAFYLAALATPRTAPAAA
jgi:hypothetical protein